MGGFSFVFGLCGVVPWTVWVGGVWFWVQRVDNLVVPVYWTVLYSISPYLPIRGEVLLVDTTGTWYFYLLERCRTRTTGLRQRVTTCCGHCNRSGVIGCTSLFGGLPSDSVVLLVREVSRFRGGCPRCTSLVPVERDVCGLGHLRNLRRDIHLRRHRLNTVAGHRLGRRLTDLTCGDANTTSGVVNLTIGDSTVGLFSNAT